LSSSDESVFEYDLPEGYDSQNELNPEFIPILSSGSENGGESSDEDAAAFAGTGTEAMPDFDDLSNLIMS